MKTCKALIDAGCPNYRTKGKIVPVKPANDKNGKAANQNIWPRLDNGRLAHGSFLILKGEEYRVDNELLDKKDKDGKPSGLSLIFEEIKSFKKSEG